MDKKQVEAYTYFKRVYPKVITLYHIQNNYVALGDDAVAVATVLVGNVAEEMAEFEFPCNDIEIISKLGDYFPLKMVDYRNCDGNLDFPDIQKLKQEKYEDY